MAGFSTINKSELRGLAHEKGLRSVADFTECEEMKAEPQSIKDSLHARGYREVSPGVMEKIAVTAAVGAEISELPPKKKKPRDLKVLDRRFTETFSKVGGLMESLVPEYRFHPVRKWRADYYHPATKTLIEIEGGLHMLGKHNKAEGFVKDAVKYNTAESMGFRVFRLPSALITEDYLTQLLGWLNLPR